MYNQKEHLVGLIYEAFEGVNLEDGVSIRQTEVIDDYGSDAEMNEARKRDKLTDWPSLIDDPVFDEVTGIGGASFLDDKGIRFYTPVYMTMLIQDEESCPDECDYLLGRLVNVSSKEGKKIREIFNKKQVSCLRKCFKYILNNTGSRFGFDSKKLKKAIEEWKEMD